MSERNDNLACELSERNDHLDRVSGTSPRLSKRKRNDNLACEMG